MQQVSSLTSRENNPCVAFGNGPPPEGPAREIEARKKRLLDAEEKLTSWYKRGEAERSTRSAELALDNRPTAKRIAIAAECNRGTPPSLVGVRGTLGIYRNYQQQKLGKVLR